MRYSILYILATISLLPNHAFSQYQDMYFINPQSNWYQTYANVHESTFEIHPKGTFSEVDLFITFSSSDPQVFSEDELIEMVSYFELPEDVMVSDLWLWFEEEILVAHIIDRWTANRVYEGIVNRQQDPAILFKDSPTSYHLRIYPFKRDEIRKLKLSFLIPNQSSDNITSVQLPNALHKLAEELTDDAVIRYFSEEAEPVIGFSEFDDYEFTSHSDSLDRNYWETTVNSVELRNSVTLEIEKDDSDVFLTTYSDSVDNYYSFSFKPKSFLDVNTSKEVAVILDFATSKSTFEKQEILDVLRNSIKANFTEDDSFNFLYSDLSAMLASENWINASDNSVDSLFDAINPDDISGLGNLDDLLAESIDFIQESGYGDILLVSSSDSYQNFEDANSFAESVLNYVDDNLPKINIINIQDRNEIHNWRNGRYYTGNEYLYGILTRESGGELFDYNDSEAAMVRINTGFKSLDGNIYNVDVYTTFTSGFSYGRHHNQKGTKLPLNSSYIQTGKFYGDVPMTIFISGTVKDSVINEQFEINDFIPIDSTLKRYWVGNEISTLEAGNPSNEDITTVIDYSMDNRILSRYTSFLALEPGDSSLVNSEQDDDVTDTDDEEPDSFKIDSIYAYPNPFNPTVTIGVELTQAWDASNSSITIYNMLGQVVAVLNTSQFNGSKSFTIAWDINEATAQLSTGVYLVRVQTPHATKHLKITYLK